MPLGQTVALRFGYRASYNPTHPENYEGARAELTTTLSVPGCQNGRLPHHHLFLHGDSCLLLPALCGIDCPPLLRHASDDRSIGACGGALPAVARRALCVGLLPLPGVAFWPRAWLATDGMDIDR